ncbi:hypothetical protein Cylst_1622 [Cylindrospermum stagnale PCC 7417]|uniref:Immunity protein 30 domain-containing protein n=1 Tax=Cylindrospermum stagnale PCC 7417 TaxID=56107 RepID=K9WU38_9NOST|nr:hypothetical protein [Cylindrospermum stagnale]AFZ23900.1 hypothetical protein Cylst_1622 [Cylindrospermum stagnale PCC 7417]
MTTFDDLLSIVTDPMISPDGWGDYYLEVVIELAHKLSQSGEIQECLQHLPLLDEEAHVRLIQVITNFPSSQLFEPLLGLLVEADGELAEVLIDGLRTWSLDREQRQQLLLVAEKFRGQSKLLDMVINELTTGIR